MRTPTSSDEAACYEVPWEFTCRWHQPLQPGRVGGKQQEQQPPRPAAKCGGEQLVPVIGRGQHLPDNGAFDANRPPYAQYRGPGAVNAQQANGVRPGPPAASPALGVAGKLRSHSHSASPSCSSHTGTSSSNSGGPSAASRFGQLAACVRAPEADCRPSDDYDPPWDLLKAHRLKQASKKRQSASPSCTISQAETIQSPIAAVRMLTGTNGTDVAPCERTASAAHWTPPPTVALGAGGQHDKSTLSSSSSGGSSARGGGAGSAPPPHQQQCATVTTAFCAASGMHQSVYGGDSGAQASLTAGHCVDRQTRESIIQKIAAGVPLSAEETGWLALASHKATKKAKGTGAGVARSKPVAADRPSRVRPHVIQVNSTVDWRAGNVEMGGETGAQEIIYDQVPDEDGDRRDDIPTPPFAGVLGAQRSLSTGDATVPSGGGTAGAAAAGGATSCDTDTRPVDEYDVPWEFRARRVLRDSNAAAAADGARARTRSVEAPGASSVKGDSPPAGSQCGQASATSNRLALSRNQLSLNLGCSALNPVAEEFDADLPLRRQGWYHGNITRGEAESRLVACAEGAYLVRLCETNKNEYALSLKSAKGYMHMKIQPSDQPPASATTQAGEQQESRPAEPKPHWVLGYFSQPFDRIADMVRYYSINKLPIKGADHMCLLHPVNEPLL